MASKPPPNSAVANGNAPAQKSDLADLWAAAVEDYERRTKKSLQLGSWGSMEAVIQGTEVEKKKLLNFRHDGGKADKVRTAFKNNLWLIQKVVTFVNIAANTAAAFPPAMPATLIFNAFGQVMTSFNQMSADYDKVVGFFEFTQRFLDRLSMIEGQKATELEPFRRCVMRVFTSMLTICAVAQDYAKEHGRFKKWFNTLMDGSDPGLAGAYKNMESAINEMSDAVGLATLRTVSILAEIVKSMEESVEFVVTKTTFIDERTKRIESKVDIVIDQGQVMDSKQDAVLAKQDEMSALMKKYFERDRSGHDKTQEKDSKFHPGQRKVKTDPVENKRVALNQVASFLTALSPKLEVVRKETQVQRKEIHGDSVPGTGTWLLKDEELYKAWVDQEKSVVWIRGNAGIGKSFLAEAVVTSLETTSSDRKSFAYSFFREEVDNLRSFTESLYCMAYQLAETDPKYCEQLASELSKDNKTLPDPWQRLFAERFPSKGGDHAYLILDGIDEMKEDEFTFMVKCLDQVAKEELNIHVLLTGRPSASEQMETLNLPIIEVSKRKIATDIERVTAQNLKKLPRLKTFRKPVRLHILNKVRENADGMRYMDHQLRRLNMIGREKAVLKDLKKNNPKDLQELYDLMLKEVQANRSKEQYVTLKKLFAWLAYSKRALTLDEAAELISRTVHEDHMLDIEDEIIGRSAPILEIVKSRDAEDDDDEERATDDSDNAGESIEVNIQEGGQTPVAFQERSLREYFQAIDVDENGLRTPPSAAHLTIFEMAADLLFNANEKPKDSEQPKLLFYASSFWVQHFVEIDLGKATDDEVKRLVNALHKIMSNHNNVARTFEHFAELPYSEMTPDKEGLWLNNVKEWAGRASNSPGLLAPEVETWAKEIATSQEPLMVLARGHVSNWYSDYNGLRIYKAFTFARDAFKLSNIDVSADTLESVLKVADQFSDIAKTAGSMRAIGATLAELELIDDSIKYATQGLEMLGSEKSALKFYLTRSVSMSHAQMGRNEEAIQDVDNAIEALPQDWKDDSDLTDVVEGIYEEKASYLSALERPDDAINAYNSSKGVRPENPDNGYFLDDMTRIWTGARDPDGSKLLGLLHNWTEKERISWFGYIFEWYDTYAIARFNEVAAQNGEAGKTFLLQCYNNYMATIPASSDKPIFLSQVTLANIYHTVVLDQQKAKELYFKVLDRPIKDIGLRGSVEGILFQVRRSLAELIFEEFCRSTDPGQKMKLLDEIKGFSSQRTDVHDSFEIEGSNVSVMIALMSRVVGQATEFEAIMKKTFKTCVEGLSDTVGWNDSSSFRLLAKVLACLEGLERDALISISCQYSKVTDEPETDEETFVVTEGSEAKIAEGDLAVQDAEATDENALVNKDSNSEEKEIHPDEPGQQSNEPEQDHTSGSIHITETTFSSTTVEDGVLKESTTVIIEEASVGADHESDASKPTEGSKDEPPKSVYDEEEKLQPNTDEELSVGGGLSCDGECGRSWSSWEVPIYFCLLCTNCDLCPTCYNKRMAQNSGEPSTYWRPYCGENHRYAKGPIKGWKGINGGVMRIEGKDGELEEIKVQDWLKELDVRWNKAWENFWRRLEGVKDLGM